MSVEKLLSGRRDMASNPIGDLTTKLSQITTSRAFNDSNIAKYAISTESLDANTEQLLTSVYSNMETTIRSIAQDFGTASLESFQLEAATFGGIFGSNPTAVLSSKLRPPAANSVIMNSSVADSFVERPMMAMEAYDERDNRNAQLYTIVYNLLASRQDDLGETFFPTIVVNPGDVGVSVSVKLFYVYNDFKRSVTGSLANYGRKNIIRAYADSQILLNELTRAVPVIRTGGVDDNTAMFVPVATVPGWSVPINGSVSVPTAAMKVDTRVDLIGLSQTNELLASGVMGPSDTLDTYLKLESVYIRLVSGIDTDVIRISTENLPGSVFTFAPQGNGRRMILSLDSDSIVMDNTTICVDNTIPSILTELATNKVRLQLGIAGSITLDKGDCIVNRGGVSLVTMRNAAGLLVTGPTFDVLAAKFATAEVIGYTLVAYRANSNIRQRGQLLDSQVENRSIPIRYRSPLSSIMPAINAGGDDSTALQALIRATGVRVSNDAVTAILTTQAALASYVPVANANGDLPEMDGIGHLYVKPSYFEEIVDLSLTVNNTKSQDKLKDIRAAIVEKIRFYANTMYRDSEYRSAAAVLTGNIGYKPCVIIGTDTTLWNYLQADGDLRTLGDSFDCRIVPTQDTRLHGKIVISFGVFDSARNTSINPLNFGNNLWCPELTVVLPVSRDGSVSKEILVTPRYLHKVQLPIMTVLNIVGLPAVVGKVAMNTHVV